jgi:hypothetical protein
MFIIGGLLSRQTEYVYAQAGIAFILIFNSFSQTAWTPINNLYAPEIMTFDIRAKGLAFQQLCVQTASLINTFGVPPALVTLSYKVYFMFGAWDVLGFTLIYFFMAETKGVSLEQMEDIFSAPYPKRKAAEIIRAHEEKRKQADQL